VTTEWRFRSTFGKMDSLAKSTLKRACALFSLFLSAGPLIFLIVAITMVLKEWSLDSIYFGAVYPWRVRATNRRAAEFTCTLTDRNEPSFFEFVG
jgi:hypothetical protein